MAYEKTVWKDNETPAINAENLNHIEQGIEDCDKAMGGCWISFTDEEGNPTTEPYVHWYTEE